MLINIVILRAAPGFAPPVRPLALQAGGCQPALRRWATALRGEDRYDHNLARGEVPASQNVSIETTSGGRTGFKDNITRTFYS